MLGVVVAVAAAGRSSLVLMVEIEAAVGVAISFADASLRPRRDEHSSTFAMLKVVSSLCQCRRGVALDCRRDRSVGGWYVFKQGKESQVPSFSFTTKAGRVVGDVGKRAKRLK